MTLSNLKAAFLLSYICMASVSAAIITPALPYIERSYSLSHGAVEWVVSIFLLGYVLGQLIYGPIAKRFGALWALRYGLIINLLGIGLCLVAINYSDYFFLLMGRFVTALGAASGLACTFMLLNQWLPPSRAKTTIAYSMVAFTLGIGIAVILGGLITQYFQWQDCFILLLIHGIIMLVLTYIYPSTSHESVALHPKIIVLGYLKTLKNRQLVIFSLAVGLASAFAYGYSAAAPMYAHDLLNLTPSQYGYWNSINLIGMLASGFLSSFLIKKYGTKFVLLTGLGFMFVCLLSLILLCFAKQANILWFFSTTMLLYLFTGLIFPTASYYASNSCSDTINAASMMSFINMGSASLAVIIMGYLSFSTIISFAIMLVSFFVLVSVLILLSNYFGWTEG